MNPWSCDTFVAMPDATVDGRVLVGKNSDRPVGESQPLAYFPRTTGSYAHLGGSPYWCAGHELGLNEFGVAIGNEALFTRDLAAHAAASRRGESVPTGILGMKLVRLGLERGRTAAEAVDCITDLVEREGQWGSAVPGKDAAEGAYDNSFLIADPAEAWVVETSGRTWAASRVGTGTRAISNEITIRTSWDRASPDLVTRAAGNGWWQGGPGEPFDVARAYADPGTPLQVSHLRLQRSRSLLAAAAPQVGVETAKRILRDHYEDTLLGGPSFHAARPDFLTLCMHSHPAGFTWGNTAASAIFVLPRGEHELPFMWWTPVTPCTGIYIPLFVAAGAVPVGLDAPGRVISPARDAAPDTYDERSYWWHLQRLLEATIGPGDGWAFPARQQAVRAEFDPLEKEFAAAVPHVQQEAAGLLATGRADEGRDLLRQFSSRCARQALTVADRLRASFEAADAG